MNAAEIDRLLKHTLADNRLSRGEKKVLAGLVKEYGTDDNKLAFLRHRAFEVARGELMGPEALGVLDWLEDAVKALQPRETVIAKKPEAFFSPEDNCPQKIVNLLQLADRAIDICVFTITDDRITNAIIDVHRRNVSVRVITDNDKSQDKGSDIDRLRRNDISVRTDETHYHMHHKFAVFDEKTLLTGSYNWTRSASEHNEENFIVTDATILVAEFGRIFNTLWNELR